MISKSDSAKKSIQRPRRPCTSFFLKAYLSAFDTSRSWRKVKREGILGTFSRIILLPELLSRRSHIGVRSLSLFYLRTGSDETSRPPSVSEPPQRQRQGHQFRPRMANLNLGMPILEALSILYWGRWITPPFILSTRTSSAQNPRYEEWKAFMVTDGLNDHIIRPAPNHYAVLLLLQV